MIKKILSLTLSLIFVGSLLCSCSPADNSKEQTLPSETDIELPADPSDRYYKADLYNVGVDGYDLGKIIDSENGKIAVFYKWDEGDTAYYHYRLSKHENGSQEWDQYVDIDSSGKLLFSFCYIGDNRLVAGTYYGFDVYDLNTGELINQNEDLFMIIDSPLRISRHDNGFVMIKNDCVYLIGEDYSVISEISFDEEGYLAEDSTYFTQNGRDYLVLDDYPVMQYYEIDFERKTISPVCSSADLDLSWNYCYRTGKYAYDYHKGIIYELDLLNKTKKEMIYTSNILIKPALMSSISPVWYIFSESELAVLYDNSPAQSEILLFRPDNDSNLAQRTKLTVRGYRANEDICLANAAYLYNTSQDKYLILVENYDNDKYGYNNAEEAQASKLNLLKDFVSGDAPDIFFGNDFDYDQMGRSGLVMDLAEYLKGSDSINEDTISKNIYDLYFDEGHCYKLFTGYTMFGLWSNAEFTGNNDNMTIDDMSASTYSPRIFIGEESCNIADFAIRYPIRRLIKDGEFINEEELEKIIQFAIDNGSAPSSGTNSLAYSSTVASKENAVYLSYVGFINVFRSNQYEMKQELKFVGFPSLDGAVHVAYPQGLVAVSESTQYPEECMKFIEFMFSDEVQKAMLASNQIPVNKSIFNEALEIALDRSKLGDDMYYRIFFGDDENGDIYTQEEVESYCKAVESVDTIMIMDWGLYNIIAEEVNSYFSQHKDIKDIAHSMRSRIVLYLEENYK